MPFLTKYDGFKRRQGAHLAIPISSLSVSPFLYFSTFLISFSLLTTTLQRHSSVILTILNFHSDGLPLPTPLLHQEHPLDLSSWPGVLHVKAPPGFNVQPCDEATQLHNLSTPCVHEHYVQLSRSFMGMWLMTDAALRKFMESPMWEEATALNVTFRRAACLVPTVSSS